MFLYIQTDECLSILVILYLIKQLLEVICILIPLVLIVMLSIDLSKGVISDKENDKKILDLVIKRLVLSVFIFLLPNLIFGLFDILLSNDDSKNCWNYMGEKSLKEVREMLEAQDSDTDDSINNKEEEQKQKDAEKKEANKTFKKTIKSLSVKDSVASSDGVMVGKTYSLTDKQLRHIAYLCQREQGSAKGAAAEASLMANRFELYAGSSYSKNATGLYNYIKNSGWWSGSKTHMSGSPKVKSDILDAVKSVLVLGKRTLPLYIDEHDCIYCGGSLYDVSYIVNNGKKITSTSGRKDHSNYIKDVTKIHNRYGAVYTFYSFPTKNADPFGYTATAKNKIKSKTNK